MIGPDNVCFKLSAELCSYYLRYKYEYSTGVRVQVCAGISTLRKRIRLVEADSLREFSYLLLLTPSGLLVLFFTRLITIQLVTRVNELN